MQSCLVPYFFRYWIGPVAKPRNCFGKRQRGVFGLGKIRRFAPRSYSKETVVCLADLFEFSGAHIDADATTIDLAGAQMKDRVCAGTQLFLTAAIKAINGCIASGISVAGFFIRGCIVFIFCFLSLLLVIVYRRAENFAAA